MQTSVIICTRNRADSLRLTLEAMGKVTVPGGWIVELLVVDNGSADHTRAVVNEARLNTMNLRYLSEPRTGLSHARNAGLAAANGEVLLFTDDDIVPVGDWLEKIAGPLLRRECEGVQGQVRLADGLSRPWMRQDHKRALAICGDNTNHVEELIGANMGVLRLVFDRIPGFDPELGAGASGFAEETLFGWQMEKAGFRLKAVPEALVVHYPDVSRLLRSQWLKAAHQRGVSQAYILHHWRHVQLKRPWFRYYYLFAKLWIRRMLQPPPSLDKEGCPPWEMSYVAEMALCWQFIREHKRPKKYPRQGFRKIE